MDRKRIVIAMLGVMFAMNLAAQNIESPEEYSQYYNRYLLCHTKKAVVAPWLLNGILVEKGYGLMELHISDGHTDTVPFLYYKGCMSFVDSDYRKVTLYEKGFCHTNRGGTVKEVTLKMNCINESTGEFSVSMFVVSFPVEWVVCAYADENLSSHVYRITRDSGGEYVVSLDTYGYYLSYSTDDRRRKQSLMKKHVKCYGRL